MSERQPNDTKGNERQDFDDESSFDTVRDPKTLGERALAIALRELGPEMVAEAAARAAESDAKQRSAGQQASRIAAISTNEATEPDRKEKIMSSSLQSESNVKKKRRSLFRRKKTQEVSIDSPIERRKRTVDGRLMSPTPEEIGRDIYAFSRSMVSPRYPFQEKLMDEAFERYWRGEYKLPSR